MNSLRLKRIVYFLSAGIILLFVGYQVYHAHFARQKTEIALYKTAEQSITVSGYAVRQESLLTNPHKGVLQYAVPDGGKVDKGGTVAHAYKSVEDAGVLQKKEQLTKELTNLQALAGQGSAVGTNANAKNLESLLDEQLLHVLADAQLNGMSAFTDSRLKFLSLLNEKQLTAGQVKNFSARISALQKQISALSSSGNGEELGKVTSGTAGYFSSKADGYESVFSYPQATELFPENLKDVRPKPVPENAVGRVCGQFNWYFVCVVNAQDAAKFKPDTALQLTFPFVSPEKVQATVVRVNQRGKNADAAVILQCNEMNRALINIRHETARITLHTYQGLQISQKAVHFEKVRKTTVQNGKTVTEEKMVEGVYVLYGIEMKFKQIVPLYSDGTYLYCAVNPDKGKLDTEESVQLYDEVIVEGKGLSDGKIIE